jgi:hypothetical protein
MVNVVSYHTELISIMAGAQCTLESLVYSSFEVQYVWA